MAPKETKEKEKEEKKPKISTRSATGVTETQQKDKENVPLDSEQVEALTKAEMAKKQAKIAEMAKQKSQVVSQILSPISQNKTVTQPGPVSTPSVRRNQPTATITTAQMNVIPPYLQNNFQVSPVPQQNMGQNMQNVNQNMPNMGQGVQQMWGAPQMQPMQPMYSPMTQPMMPYMQQPMMPQMVSPQYQSMQQAPRLQYVDLDDPYAEDPDDQSVDIVEPFGDYEHKSDPKLNVKLGSIDEDQWLADHLDDNVNSGDGEESVILLESDEGEASGPPVLDDGEGDEFDEAFYRSELVIESKEVGPPVRASVKKFADEIWDYGIHAPKDLHIADTYKLLYRPKNMENFVVPEMNDIVQQLIPKKKFKRDTLPTAIHNGILKCADGLLHIWDIISPKSAAFPQKADTVRLIMKCLKALSYSNGRMDELRRAQMKPYLPYKYWPLCDEVEDPSHKNVFGKKFEEAIEKRDKVCKMVNHVNSGFSRGRGGSGGGPNFRRGGRAGGRGRFQPYGQFTQRGQFYYDNYGNAFREYPNVVYYPNDSNVNNSNVNTYHVSQITSPGQIMYDYLPQFYHPGEIGTHPNTSLCCSPSEEPREQETIPRWQTTSTHQRWPTEEGQLDNPRIDTSHTVVGDTQYLSEIYIREEFLVGGLAQCYDKWLDLTSDPEILEYVRGVKLDFIETPVQDKLPHEIIFSAEEKKLVKKEIKEFLELGILKKSKLERGDFVSNLFARPKKEPGRVRLIANLKSLNMWIKFIHFKMDGVQDVINLMKPGMYMVSIDFTSSFYSINVDPQYRRYLKVICLGQIMEFQALPMGYSRSPLIFCKLLKVPLTYLREHFGYTNCAFVDDVWMGEDTIPEVEQNARDSLVLFQDCGYTANIPKSDLGPGQIKPHLGWIFNSLAMTISLTEDKIAKFIDHAEKILKQDTQIIRSVASLIGQMNAAAYAVRYGPLHTKSLEIAKIKALAKAGGDFEQKMQLSKLDKLDIKWWVNILPNSSKFVGYLPIDAVIHTDASTEGWGLWQESTDTKTGGRWSMEEKKSHINILEIWAIYLGIQCLFDLQRHLHIQIFCDTKVAIACVEKQGSTHSLPCNSATRKLLLYCENHDFVLTLSHISSIENCQPS